MKNSNLIAHLALFGANAIYGINYTFAKDVMPDYIQPFGFIVARVIGALALFWVTQQLFFREGIDKKDLPRLAACGLFGVALNQLTFFSGLNITTPINAAIIMTTNPILVLIAAAFFLQERITVQRILGIGLGLVGAFMIILFKGDFSIDTTTWTGDLLVFVNSMSYGIYLVMVKPLMKKYQPITVIKWVFSFGFIYVLPFGWTEFNEVEWSAFPTDIALKTAFVIVFTTFFAYLLNTVGLKKLSPSTVSTYIYSQPILAALFAISLGKDQLDVIKIIAATLIFSGVFIVSRKFS